MLDWPGGVNPSRPRVRILVGRFVGRRRREPHVTIWARATGCMVRIGFGAPTRRRGKPRRATLLGLAGLLVAFAVVGCAEELPAGSPSDGPTAVPSAEGSVTPMGGFIATGSMKTRYYQSAALLSNGRVLIAGGSTDITGLGDTSAELFDPATGTFTQTGSMTVARMNQSATRLLDGRVLIAGGSGDASAELYDPASGTFRSIGPMTAIRSQPTAVLLLDGRVLLVGGSADLTSVELYDPQTGKFTKTGSMTTARAGATATLLSDGRVLVAGGSGLASAEVYDPRTGAFTATGPMAVGRSGQTATRLADGRVLIAGGRVIGLSSLDSAEIYDPKTYDPKTRTSGSFSPAGTMTTRRSSHTATALADGRVLLVGGAGSGASAEVYVPKTGQFIATGSLVSEHSVQTATLLGDGRVLIAGGNGGYGGSSPAELYKP